ncbi:Modulator of FtsH protease HflC [Methyloligella halotolerans]|uniref:Modulator of FtsH protease HflC n=1 Tax=Methyloligella halotolerans TaxID=1177755 RepID=A0A1E2S3G7_9HYPH|nr:Modulator of FtsH protease HflC [Methyloligella halotolerans]
MRIASIVALVLIALAAVTAYLSLFTVDPTEQALVLRFGEPKQVIKTPGLHTKVPFVDNVLYFDSRVLEVDTAPQEVIASGQKRLVVDAFARYRITDPLLFYQSVTDEQNARGLFANYLESTLRGVLGASTFEAIVRDRRDELMTVIAKEMNEKTGSYGVDFLNVRIKRVDLPDANSDAIYRRMNTERQREAAEFRAEGEGASRRIRGTADREVTVLKANAQGEAERIRGDGDAKRNRIFAGAFGQDPDFFAFYRSMQAYRSALGQNDTRFLLSPDSQFFRYFGDAAGGPETPGSTNTEKQGLAPNASFAPKDTSQAGPDEGASEGGESQDGAEAGDTEASEIGGDAAGIEVPSADSVEQQQSSDAAKEDAGPANSGGTSGAEPELEAAQ